MATQSLVIVIKDKSLCLHHFHVNEAHLQFIFQQPPFFGVPRLPGAASRLSAPTRRRLLSGACKAPPISTNYRQVFLHWAHKCRCFNCFFIEMAFKWTVTVSALASAGISPNSVIWHESITPVIAWMLPCTCALPHWGTFTSSESLRECVILRKGVRRREC